MENEWSNWEDISEKARKKAAYFPYLIHWSEENQVFLGSSSEWPYLVAHGDSLEEALHEIQYLVAATMDWDEEENPQD